MVTQIGTVKPESLQDSPEFQQEAVDALLAKSAEDLLSISGKSLGVGKAQFEQILKDYGSRLWPQRNQPKVASQIQIIQSALSQVSH
ncbi:MAG: hypothetical protein HZC17_01945 [Candidatus Omnitrophica bacterium]|nr:hypothetical protein [Candidatus Omnitrophota bacterium]